MSGPPIFVSSLADFQRIFGDLEDLNFTDQANQQVNYLAHAVRGFFEEGGRRLFVQRVFNAPRAAGFDIQNGVPGFHYATASTDAAGFAPEMLADAVNQLAVATQTATAVAANPPSAAAQAAAEARTRRLAGRRRFPDRSRRRRAHQRRRRNHGGHAVGNRSHQPGHGRNGAGHSPDHV